ncbi:MAG: HD domain-containing protein [Nitrospirae bacterium]|nr:HD domain-containing protein [Nitrospirota bacterium]
MDDFKLKKLLKKQDVTELLVRLTKSMNSNICVFDNDDKLIYGEDCNDLTKTLPIKVHDKKIGCVRGKDERGVDVTALYLNHLAEAEAEIRTIADVTLAKNDELKMLHDFVENFNTFDVKGIADFLIKYVSGKVEGKVEADNVSVMLKNEATGELELIAHGGWPVDSIKEISKNLLTSKANIINDCQSDNRVKTDAISSLIYSPIEARGKTLGIVTASTKKPYHYKQSDLEFFRTLVSHAAVAMDNAILHESLKKSVIKMAKTLIVTLEKRDSYTGGHSERVRHNSLAIAEYYEDIKDDDIERLELAAALHDIGKIGVRDKVLLKKANLKDEEFEEIKQHPVYGEQILSNIDEFKGYISSGVKFHHEHFDGGNKAYPEKLKAEAIPISARIIAVADSFDAMTSKRPYKRPNRKKVLTPLEALSELNKYKGRQFDPKVVAAFEKALTDDKIIIEKKGK